MLYKKLSNKFKNWLVTIKKIKNLNNLIFLLCNIDTNIKKISKESLLYAKPNISIISITKLPFKSFNLAFVKLFIAIGIAAIFSNFSTATRSYPDSMDVSNIVKQGPISQVEKDRHNSLGLYYYYGKLEYIAINHKSFALLTTKK